MDRVDEAAERAALGLRRSDRIEGDEVVLVSKRGGETRLSKAEWLTILRAEEMRAA